MNAITTTEAAEIAGVNEYTIIRWCKAGNLKHKQGGINNAYIISKKSLESYLASRNLAPAGYVAVATAAGYYDNLTTSTIRRMASDGRLPSKRVRHHLYIEKKALSEMGASYDAKKARQANGRRTAAMIQNRESIDKPLPKYPPATERQIAHDHIMANIENMTWKRGKA